MVNSTQNRLYTLHLVTTCYTCIACPLVRRNTDWWHRTIQLVYGSWKYVTNSDGGNGVVPRLPAAAWPTLMYLKSSFLHSFNGHTSFFHPSPPSAPADNFLV